MGDGRMRAVRLRRFARVRPLALAAFLMVAQAIALGGAAASPAVRRAAMPAPGAIPAMAMTRAAWRRAVTPQHYPGPAGRLRFAGRVGRAGVAVFVYHQVCPPGWRLRNGPDYVTPARLAQTFAYLRAHRIATLTSAQFVAYLNGRAKVAPGSVYLTFDNGLEGVYRYAYPLALRYRVHITAFLIGDRLRPRWRPGMKYLGWNQVVTMAASGLVDMQSETYDLHTRVRVAAGRSAPAIAAVAPALAGGRGARAYARRLAYAFARQRSLFERYLHQAPTLLVWPFSTYTAVAAAEARAAGYQAAFAVYPGLVWPTSGMARFALPRNPATFMWNNVPEEYVDLMRGQFVPTRQPYQAIT